MRIKFCGHPVAEVVRSFAACLAVSGFTVLGGCAQSRQYADPAPFTRVGAPPPTIASADVLPPKVDNEADGLPAQLPPRRGIRNLPDDPREPWSPNYGAGHSSPPPSGPSAPAYVPTTPGAISEPVTTVERTPLPPARPAGTSSFARQIMAAINR